MKRRIQLLAVGMSLIWSLAGSPRAYAGECEPKSTCFGLESVSASISTHQAGDHPDLTLFFSLRQDPSSSTNAYGLHEPYAPMRNAVIDLPPGFVGNPNVLGLSQQCTVQELVTQEPVVLESEEDGCPNGSQVGVATLRLFAFPISFTEPVYMMQPPGGDVIARLGMVAGIYPTFIDFKIRSESDYGLTTELLNASPNQGFVQADVTTWGVPAAPEHDTERCTPKEVWPSGCTESTARPPGSRRLAFLTNPTSCGSSRAVTVSVDGWFDPGTFDTREAELPQISGCDRLPFKPSLAVQPTSRRPSSPTGLELSYRLPVPEGAEVLESSHLRHIQIDFPAGLGINSAAASGLGTCSVKQVHLGENVAAECPDAAKLADVEIESPALSRRMKGAIYQREPEPGHLFRVWIVADDLGAHIKLRSELEIDETTGQITATSFDLPQLPVREVRLLFKSGFRAPLVNPAACGTYHTHWEFTPWSGTATVGGETPMTISEGCETGGFAPRLAAGSTNPAAGLHAPFAFAITREDGEQNLASLDVELPPGFAATFAGVSRCEGAAAETGTCPVNSQIGRVLTATGAGPTPLWTPEPGKQPTAVYLGGPYRGAPLSAIAVVPAQAGPFDLGDVVVRSPIFIDPETAIATVKSDPLPQFIQGVPILYRVTEVILDRPNFTLNPTDCSPMSVDATVRSAQGAVARPSSYFQASGCPQLRFGPKLSLRLIGGTRRGDFPRLQAVLKARKGDANIGAAQVILPGSEFVENAHFVNVCTRVQFVADKCPADSIYGTAVAETPLFDFPLKGSVYLRTTPGKVGLPDLVAALKGPASLPIEVDLVGDVDSVGLRLRTTFDSVPDAPVRKFTLRMRGGAKGLIVNSTNLCASVHHASAKFTGQNGKRVVRHPLVKVSCGARARKRR